MWVGTSPNHPVKGGAWCRDIDKQQHMKLQVAVLHYQPAIGKEYPVGSLQQYK
jgi:hypothetical protein